MDERIRKQFLDRICDLTLRGQRFLPVRQHELALARNSRLQDTRLHMLSHTHDEQSQVSHPAVAASQAGCAMCPFCPASGRVFSIEPEARKRLLVVLDQPFAGDTLAEDLAQKTSPNALIARLLEKAGLWNSAHICYSLRSLVPTLPLESWVDVCAKTWLKNDIEKVRPELVFLFGARAHRAFLALGVDSKGAVFCAAPVSASVGGIQMQVVLFPSALELMHFSSWRLGVWEAVQAVLQAHR